jgi:predicted dehydrogenase
MARMRLGMLGMWHSHAQGFVKQVVAHPEEFELVGFWDPEPEVVRERSRAWKDLVPGFRLFDAPEGLLRQQLDGVAVEGRVHENLRYARLALEAGFPVMLEKPAGHDLAQHRALVEFARSKHLHLQMLYIFRYMSATLELLRRCRAGELGAIYEFRGRLPKQLPEYARFEEELKLYRGGIFFEMAGHLIDIMVAALGPPRSVTPHLAHHDPRPGRFVDNGLAVFEFERAFGIVEVPQLEVVGTSRRIEVYGTQGALVIPHLGTGHLPNKDIQPVEVCAAGKSDWQQLDLKAADLHLADLREFAAVVARKKEPEFSLEHDLAVQEWLLRASGMA